jgi:hypothetical protein
MKGAVRRVAIVASAILVGELVVLGQLAPQPWSALYTGASAALAPLAAGFFGGGD